MVSYEVPIRLKPTLLLNVTTTNEPLFQSFAHCLCSHCDHNDSVWSGLQVQFVAGECPKVSHAVICLVR